MSNGAKPKRGIVPLASPLLARDARQVGKEGVIWELTPAQNISATNAYRCLEVGETHKFNALCI